MTAAGGRAERLRPKMPAEAPNGAKLLVPQPRSAHIRRRRLVERLVAHRGVGLVIAPPGFGKTTLLGQWAMADSRSFAWVSFDADDNDPVVLWTYIKTAIRSLAPSAAADVAEERKLRDPNVLVSRLIDELAALGSEVVLVLDDFQWITNPVGVAIMDGFLERRPDNVTVVLSSRADPALPVGKLRVDVDLLELGAADLAFTLDETEAFLNGSLGLGLRNDAIRSVWDRTEGWPAGLYIAYLSLRDSADPETSVKQFSGSSRHVVDYLSGVVLDRLDEETRDFLLGTSILDRLTGPLCDAVLETQDSSDVLVRLERANLFIVGLDDHRVWYRYHRLFVQLLRDVLKRRYPDRLPGLHHRAAVWFRNEGDTGRVIAHALRAGDREMAVEAVSENYLRTLEWGGIATLEAWLSEFSRGDIAADARLAIVEAWLMSFQGRYAESDVALANAARAEYEGPLPDGARSVEASAALLRASAPRNSISEMLAAARTAFDLESEGTSMWRVTTHVQLGWALVLSGEFSEAEPLLERAAVEAPMREQWLDAFGARCLLSWASLYQGRLESADRWAREGVRTVERYGLADTPAGQWAYATLGAVRGAQNRIEEADALLTPSVDRMRTATPPILLVATLLALAPVRRALGHVVDARGILDEAAAIVDGFDDPGILGVQLERVAKSLTPAHRHVRDGSPLTERELDVLRLLERGMSKREIANRLFLSFNTVHSHTKSIYRKLGADRRDDAVRAARERGFLESRVDLTDLPH